MNPLPPTIRHQVDVATVLAKLQRVASTLREYEARPWWRRWRRLAPVHPLAQQVLEDLAHLLRKHLERPCQHWSGGSELPGGEA